MARLIRGVRVGGISGLGATIIVRMQTSGQASGNVRVVREFCAYLRVEKGMRPATVEAYRRDLEQLAEHVEGRNGLLVGTTQADVSGFMEGLRANGVEGRSIARKVSALRGFFRWLLLDKRIEHDPTVNVESPASWKVLPKSLAESEVAEMLERTGTAARAADADGLALRDHAILELLYAGGLRVGEICALREEDLHLDQARVQVRGKGDKERIVPLGRRAVEALERYIKIGRPGLVRAGLCRGRGHAAGAVFECAGECADSAVGLGDGAGELRRWVGLRLVRISCGIVVRRIWWSMGRI